MSTFPPTAFDRSRSARAALWFMRTQRGPLSTHEKARLKRWIAEPKNKQALLAIAATWDAANSRRLRALKLLAHRRDSTSSATASQKRRRRSNTSILATATVVMLTALAPSSAWRSAQLEPAAPMTSAHVPQTLTLEDGSVIRIAAGTQFKINLGPTRRNVHLASGEAEFNVAPDPHRPFNVRTPTLQATAVGTRFSVSRHEHSWTVAVTEGVVQVSRAGDDPHAADVMIVTAHQELTFYDSSPAASAANLPPVWVEVVGVTIGEVIARFNQRTGSHIQIATPAIAARKIPFARFRGDSQTIFLETIDNLDGVAVIRGPNNEPIVTSETHRDTASTSPAAPK